MSKRKLAENTASFSKTLKTSAVSVKVKLEKEQTDSEGTTSLSRTVVTTTTTIVNTKETVCKMDRHHQKDAVIVAMRNVYFGTIHNMPIPSLHKHSIIQGATPLKNLQDDEFEALIQDSSTSSRVPPLYDLSLPDYREFQSVISQYLENQLMDKINKSQLYSLLVDESIDALSRPILMVYIRIIEQEGLQWVPKTYFLGLRHVKYDDDENVPKAILGLLEDKGLSLEFLSGIAIDGASELLGCKTGIVTSLKTLCPGLVSNQCIAHRLALGCGDAADSSWCLIQFQNILNSVYVQVIHLSTCKYGLEDIDRVIEGFGDDILGKILGMNWLGVDGSVSALVKSYSSLLYVLMEEDFEHFPATLRLHEQLSSYKFLYCAYFLSDVLNELFILYKFYQKPDIDYSKVNHMLRSTIQVLEELRDRKSGAVLGELLKVVPAKVAENGFTFQGHLIKDSYKKREKAVKACNDFVKCTVDSLKARFLEEGDSLVLSALSSLFSPVVGELCKGQIDFIREYVLKLGMDPVDFETEVILVRFKAYANKRKQAKRFKSNIDIHVLQLCLKSAKRFPIISKLAKRFIVMPVSTVDIERGFSIKKDLSRELEKTLKDTELENLLRIQINRPNQEIDHKEDFEPTEDIDYEEVFKLWKSKPRNVLL